MTFIIMTLSIECCNAELSDYLHVVLSAIMLNVVMLSVVMLNGPSVVAPCNLVRFSLSVIRTIATTLYLLTSIKLAWKGQRVTNTLSYYDTKLSTQHSNLASFSLSVTPT